MVFLLSRFLSSNLCLIESLEKQGCIIMPFCMDPDPKSLIFLNHKNCRSVLINIFF